MKSKINKNNLNEQVSASLFELHESMREQLKNETISAQDKAFLFAKDQIDKVREELTRPENILGSDKTKHGEIAEKIEISIRNAREAIEQKVNVNEAFSATFEGVGRTAPEDYIIDGVQVQSKFINGINNNLEHVIKHMEKYEYFGRDESYYHIPKDSHNEIMKIYNNENTEGISQKTIEAIRNKIETIESESGKKFIDVVKAGESDYSEVQMNTASETLNQKENEIHKTNEEKIKEINSSENFQPSFKEGVEVAGQAALIAATIDFASFAYNKKKNENKNIWDYNSKDWKECGVSVSKSGVTGGITGGAVYGLTNFGNISAPLAGSFVAFARGVHVLNEKYQKNEISKEEFSEDSVVLGFDTGLTTLGSIAGQTIIPIPVLGALVGALSVKIVSSIISTNDTELQNELKRKENKIRKQLKKEELEIIEKYENKINKFQTITDFAFDFENNKVFFDNSIKLAKEYKVKESLIIKNLDDLDNFILS